MTNDETEQAKTAVREAERELSELIENTQKAFARRDTWRRIVRGA